MEQKYTLKDKIKAMGPGILVVGSFIGPGYGDQRHQWPARGYGYALLWTVVFSVIAVVVMQEMAARLGIVTPERPGGGTGEGSVRPASSEVVYGCPGGRGHYPGWFRVYGGVT